MSVVYWPTGEPILAGQVVSCERARKAKGTWLRYEGRRGTVEYIEAGEVRVAFDGGGSASFLPSELILLPASLQTDATVAPEGPVCSPEARKGAGGSGVAKGALQGLTERSVVIV